jgi:hypothetical protein
MWENFVQLHDYVGRGRMETWNNGTWLRHNNLCPYAAQKNSWISGETKFLYYHILTTIHFSPITICCSLLKRKLNVKEKDLHFFRILCSITGCLLPTVLRPCSSLISGGFVTGHLTLWQGHWTVSKWWTTNTQWWSMISQNQDLNWTAQAWKLSLRKRFHNKEYVTEYMMGKLRVVTKQSSVVCKNLISWVSLDQSQNPFVGLSINTQEL